MNLWRIFSRKEKEIPSQKANWSRNWLERSKEAEKEGVCHTESECKQMYSEIPKWQKDAAIKVFRESAYYDSFPEIRERIKRGGDRWIVPYHMWWGMGVRNFFREKEFGEQYFSVDNLDCIYRQLVEDAVKE